MSDFQGAQSGAGGGSLSVGAVIKRSFGVFFANIVPFGILALVLNLPGLLYNLGTIDEMLSGAAPSFPPERIAILVVATVLSYVLMGAVVYGTISQLRGSNPGMGKVVLRGFATALPVVFIGIVFSILMAIGFMLVVIPGIFVVVIFAVTVPAYIVEKPGLFGCFGRSRQLTKGYRWQVFGILLILLVILVIISLVVGAAAGITVVMGMDLTMVMIVNYVISSLSLALMSVAIAVMYHDLRVAKEGVSTAQIAAVFD